jgi:hypothetical protein
MTLDLIVEKNIVLKRDTPWTQFYCSTDHSLLCFNEQKQFESVNLSNGKIEHVSNKIVTTNSKSSLAHCQSNNGQLCAFVSSHYDITIWDKNKSIRTLTPCISAIKAVKSDTSIYLSNTGEQLILILKQPCRIFLWLNSFRSLQSNGNAHRTVHQTCCNLSNRSTDQAGTWHELNLTVEQLQILDNEQHRLSIDVFFSSMTCSALCAFAIETLPGTMQVIRLDIDWKPVIYAEQFIVYTFEIIRIPLTTTSRLSSIRFAHVSPLLAINLSTHVLIISLTTVNFSKMIPVDFLLNTASTPQTTCINDIHWSFNDQFVIGLTDRGRLFFLHRFGSQVNLMTKGDCISQGPARFVIIHPLIGKDSEATNHLGLASFMDSIRTFSEKDKSKQQKFSLAVHADRSTIFCSDGYRLARLVYSDKICDRRFYDPLLYLRIMDSNYREQHRSVFIHRTR